MNQAQANAAILAQLGKLIVQNEELAREIASLQAKVEMLQHQLDTIAEEAGMI